MGAQVGQIIRRLEDGCQKTRNICDNIRASAIMHMDDRNLRAVIEISATPPADNFFHCAPHLVHRSLSTSLTL